MISGLHIYINTYMHVCINIRAYAAHVLLFLFFLLCSLLSVGRSINLNQKLLSLCIRENITCEYAVVFSGMESNFSLSGVQC